MRIHHHQGEQSRGAVPATQQAPHTRLKLRGSPEKHALELPLLHLAWIRTVSHAPFQMPSKGRAGRLRDSGVPQRTKIYFKV